MSIEFSPTGDRNYPEDVVLLVPPERLTELSALPQDVIPANTDYVQIDLWRGNDSNTKFYEGIKPASIVPERARWINPDEYLSFLEQEGFPLPPSDWRTETVVFTQNMELLTKIQVPVSEDDLQGRVVNFAQQKPPTSASIPNYQSVKTTRDYVRRIQSSGFPREAFKDLSVPSVIEAISVPARDLTRIFGANKPTPDGQLTIAVRTENTRPDARRSE